MSCVKCLGKFCVALKIIALIFHIIALGLPYWYKGDTTETTDVSGTVKTTVREGLWKKCTDLETTSKTDSFCVDNDVTTVITAIRWLMFIVTGVLGIAILATGAGHLESNKTAFIVGAIHSILSVIINATTAALYATVVKDEIGFELKHLYIGWGLIFISVVLVLVGAVLALILARSVGNKKITDGEEEN